MTRHHGTRAEAARCAGEVPTLANLADAPDCAPASAAAARALQAQGVSVASSTVASDRTSADGAFAFARSAQQPRRAAVALIPCLALL